MKGIVFTQQIGVAILLGLVVQKGSWKVPTAGAVVVRGGGSSPLLVGPAGMVLPGDGGDDSDITAPVTAATTTPATSTTTTSSSRTSTFTTTGSTKASEVASTATMSTTTSSSSATTSAPPLPTPADADGPRQTSNIRYLVPVFLLILITLAGWLYSRWYARHRKRDMEDPPTPQRDARGGWREVKGDDVDEKDPWYAGDDDGEEGLKWDDVDLRPGRSSGAVSAGGRGWGWKSTSNVWKSARGRSGEDDEEVDELGQKTTMRLVQPVPSSATYQTLPVLEGRPVDPCIIQEERGSLRALREKIAGLTYRSSPPTRGLLRAKAPNKRKTVDETDPPPEAPAWIRPRAVSPTSQILSPPLHPHLFFHPTPSAQSIQGVLGKASESGSDYGSEDESCVTKEAHGRCPTIPSTAEGLASLYTAVPPRTPKTQGTSNPRKQPMEAVDEEGNGKGKKGTMPRSVTKATRSNLLKRNSTAPSQSPTTRSKPATSPGRSGTVLRRSTAVQDLAQPDGTGKTQRASPIKVSSRPSCLAPSLTPKKSRVQRKEAKATAKVEDILKASWSDRALASPTSCQSIDGVVAAVDGVGMTSPGVEDAAVMGGMGGGIEQRLAMLKNMEV